MKRRDISEPPAESFDYVVIGGGAAGCVLAARLSEDSARTVLLLEANPAMPSPEMTAVANSSFDDEVMHVRGDRSSFDSWETAGATGWNYDALVPFFKRTERSGSGDPRFRGTRGPMRVATPTATDPLWECCLRAAIEAGHPFNRDGNDGGAGGTSWIEANVVAGRRQSVAGAYLAPVLDRGNLTLVTGAYAERLVFDGHCCSGAEYRTEIGIQTVRAVRDVILTAGAIGSSQLLLLSGIGPADHLRDVGIKVRLDLPAVGANLQQPLRSHVSYRTRRPVETKSYARKPVVLTRTDPRGPWNLQMLFAQLALHPAPLLGARDGYSILFSLTAPASRGRVRLASSDPSVAPLVNDGFVDDGEDVARMASGLRLARAVGAAAALSPFRDSEIAPGPTVQSDAEINDYLRKTVSAFSHPVGSCRIGSDDTSVVDHELRVRSIDHLRVADASVMPTLTSINTIAIVLAIAERAAHLIAVTSVAQADTTAPIPPGC